MSEFIAIMLLPFLMCVVLAGIHTYLGQHIIMREIIFVDLALAQVAVLGAAIGILLGYDIDSSQSYWITLLFSILGAILLSFTRQKKTMVSQEAIIGVIYVVAASFLILVLSRIGEGPQHIQHMLTGNILLVSKAEVLKCFILYVILGVVHYIFKDKLFAISRGELNQVGSSSQIFWYDILFYTTFALVITSSVRIVGVFVVFSFLIVPPLAAMMIANQLRVRLILGWVLGFAGSVVGLSVSYIFDFPTGPSIICVLGFVLLTIILVKTSQGGFK